MAKDINQERPIEACGKQKILLVMLILASVLCISLVSSAEGDYISNWTINTSQATITGIWCNATICSTVSEATHEIWEYSPTGTFIKNYSISPCNTPSDITSNHTQFFVVCRGPKVVMELDFAGNQIRNFSIPAAWTNPQSITENGTDIRISESNFDIVGRFNMEGTYIENYSSQCASSGGLESQNGTFLWEGCAGANKIVKTDANGTAISDWDTSASGNEDLSGVSLFRNSTGSCNFYVPDVTDNVVNIYEGNTTYGCDAPYIPPSYITLISPSDNTIFSTIGANFTANYNSSAIAGIWNNTNATYYIWNSTGDVFNNSVFVEITGTSNSTTELIDDFIIGTYEWNVLSCYENATFSNCVFADANYSFEITAFSVTGENYSVQTIEGSIETFLINITALDGYRISTATLNYNNTNYLGILDDVGNGVYKISSDLRIPDLLLSTNNTFYWNLSFSDGSFANTTFHNQSVLNLSIDDCSVYSDTIYNFTIIDEEDQDILSANVSIKILFNIYSLDRTILISNYSESFNVSSIEICLNRDLSVFTSSLLLDSTTKYSAQDHEVEYYNIESYSLNDQSEVQNILLYDLSTSDSTQFQLTFTGSDFLAVENALIFVKRQYVDENVFKTVELPKTDSNGQTILHLVRNDIVYNIEVMKGGTVIGSFENIIAFCDDVVVGDCKIILSAAESGEAIFKYDDALGITYTGPTYDETTRIITFNFLTTDGSVKNVLMNATRNDIFGNTSICSASIVSSGGTLTCVVPSYIEDSTIITKVFVNGIEILKDYTVLSDFNFGKPGYFIFFVYMLAFILMFSTDKTTMLVGIIVGFITGISLGLISGRLIGVGASGIWLIIVVILMIWKLNKDRPD